MTENRSLDDFLGGDAASDGDGRDDGADGEPDDGARSGDAPVADAPSEDASDEDAPPEAAPVDDEPDDAASDGAESAPDGVSPAVGTYRFDPDGVACPACGGTVDRLWLDDDEQVCADCKAW